MRRQIGESKVKRSNGCPTDCSGGHQRQRRLEAGALADAGLSDDWISRAMLCGYCGEVYSTEPNGLKIRRGHFAGNSLMTPENWTPYRG